MQINIKDFIENFSHISSSKDYLGIENGKFSCSILKSRLKTKDIAKFCHECLENLDQPNLSTSDKLDLAKKLSSSMKSYAIRFHQSYSHRWLYKVLSIFGYKVKLPFEFIRDKQTIDSLVNALQTRLDHSVQQRPLVEHKMSFSNKYQKQLKKWEDPFFVELQVGLDGLMLRQSKKDLRNNPDIALQAIKNNIRAYEFIGDELKKKPDFLKEYFLNKRFDPKGLYKISQTFPELKEHFFKFIQESSEIFLFKNYLRALPLDVQGCEFALFLSPLEEPDFSNFTNWFLKFIDFTCLSDPLKEKIYPIIEEYFFKSSYKIEELLNLQSLVKSLVNTQITPASVRMIFFCVIKKINSPALDGKIKNNQELFFDVLIKSELKEEIFNPSFVKENIFSVSQEIVTFALTYNQTALITKLLATFNFWLIYPMVEVLDSFQRLDILTDSFESFSIKQQNEIMKALATHNKNTYFELCNFLFDTYQSNPEKFPFHFLKVIFPFEKFDEKQGEELINLPNEIKVKYHLILNQLPPRMLNDYFCESGQDKANYEFIEKFGFINDKTRFKNRSLKAIFFQLAQDQRTALIHKLDIDRLFLLYCFCLSNHASYSRIDRVIPHEIFTPLVPLYLSQHPEKLVELLSRKSIEFPKNNLHWNRIEKTNFTLTIFKTMSISGTLEQFIKDYASNPLILKHCFGAALRDKQWLKEWTLLCKILKEASFVDWEWVYDVVDAMEPFMYCGQKELIALYDSLPKEVVKNKRSAWIVDSWIKKWNELDKNQID